MMFDWVTMHHHVGAQNLLLAMSTGIAGWLLVFMARDDIRTIRSALGISWWRAVMESVPVRMKLAAAVIFFFPLGLRIIQWVPWRAQLASDDLVTAAWWVHDLTPGITALCSFLGIIGAAVIFWPWLRAKFGRWAPWVLLLYMIVGYGLCLGAVEVLVRT